MSILLNNSPFTISAPTAAEIPVLISIPHSGTKIPDEVQESLLPKFRSLQPDTDWLVHELYGFANSIGATLIQATFSRYVIDLNRDPSGGSLYGDGRRETSLIPRLTFDGDTIYKTYPDTGETSRRVAQLHAPYYDAIERTLAAMHSKYNNVLFFDAHSIKRVVKSISDHPFPDVILGSKDGKSAAQPVIDTALEHLNAVKGLSVSHNHPFKGGHLTRHFGRPDQGIHALQLEMSQDVYLDEHSIALHKTKAPQVQLILTDMIKALAKVLADFK